VRIVWAVRLLLALAFGAAGVAKLAGVPMMVQNFEQIGLGQWFRYVTGLVEITGVLLLLVPRTGFWGGLLLGVTMLCAIAAHLLVLGGTAVPALVLALLSGFVAYRLRPSTMVAAV
jgi:uncharacterized membrane protein YphA (DoxX/SURF4 family)